jgi:hypothetical protein
MTKYAGTGASTIFSFDKYQSILDSFTDRPWLSIVATVGHLHHKSLICGMGFGPSKRRDAAATEKLS